MWWMYFNVSKLMFMGCCRLYRNEQQLMNMAENREEQVRHSEVVPIPRPRTSLRRQKEQLYTTQPPPSPHGNNHTSYVTEKSTKPVFLDRQAAATHSNRSLPDNYSAKEKDKSAAVCRSVSFDGANANRSASKKIDSGKKSVVAFTNLAFTDDLTSQKEEDEILESHILLTMQNMKLIPEMVDDREIYMDRLNEGCDKAHQDINRRKQEMIRYVEEHAASLHDRVSSVTTWHKTRTNEEVDSLDKLLGDMTSLVKYKSCNGHDEELVVISDRLEQLNKQLEMVDPECAEWTPWCLNTSSDDTSVLTSRVFGCLQGGPADIQSKNDINNSRNMKLMKQLNHNHTFRTVTPKDQRECGIVDIAMTPNKEVLVVDKHNKLVKRYSIKGVLQDYIGRRELKEPIRILVLEGSGEILISDNSLRSVEWFAKDGSHVRCFVKNIKFPAGLCEMHNGNIAVVEFATKSIIVYHTDGSQLQTIHTSSVIPVFITCTHAGHLALTDRKTNTLYLYDVTGHQMTAIKGEEFPGGPFKEPHAVVSDNHGNLLIMDRRNFRVVVLSEDGTYLCQYNGTPIPFKLAMSAACDNDGLLVVAEYTGYVKIFNYLELLTDETTEQGSESGYVQPEQVKLGEEETDD